MNAQQNFTPSQLSTKGKRQTYSGSFKAKVVIEWINHKRSLNELAEHYSIHPNQIKNWKSLLLKEAKYVLEDKRREKPPVKKSGDKKTKDLRGAWRADTTEHEVRINFPS